MLEKHLILIDDQDQSRILKSLAKKLKQTEGIKLIYKEINPTLPEFLVLNQITDKQEPDMQKIIAEIAEVPYLFRADTIAIDYNLITDALNGFDIALEIRKLGYKKTKEIILYSGKIDDVINLILKIRGETDKTKMIKSLVDGNIKFATRGSDFTNVVIEHVKAQPKFDFNEEFTAWLHKYSTDTFINCFPPYDGKALGEIAKEIEQDTHLSQEFRKAMTEQLFSILLKINELE